MEGEFTTTLVLSSLRDGVNTSGLHCLAGSGDDDLGFQGASATMAISHKCIAGSPWKLGAREGFKTIMAREKYVAWIWQGAQRE